MVVVSVKGCSVVADLAGFISAIFADSLDLRKGFFNLRKKEGLGCSNLGVLVVVLAVLGTAAASLGERFFKLPKNEGLAVLTAVVPVATLGVAGASFRSLSLFSSSPPSSSLRKESLAESL